jgi:hypothetical protein
MLHLFNGDAAAGVALRAGLPGEIAVWADTLDQGPLPSHLDGPALREARAQSFAASEGGYGSLDEIRAKVSRWNAALAAAAEHAEVVLWFEHDLCCQLALLHHLEALASHPGVFLVCIGCHPDRPRSCGGWRGAIRRRYRSSGPRCGACSRSTRMGAASRAPRRRS